MHRFVLMPATPAAVAAGTSTQARPVPAPAAAGPAAHAASPAAFVSAQPSWEQPARTAAPLPPLPIRPTPLRAFKEVPKPMNSLLMHVDSGDGSGAARPENPAIAVERVLERFGADYMASMRPVAEEIARTYAEQLSLQEKMIDELARKARAAEQERDQLQAQLRGLEFSLVKHSDELRRLGQEFISRAEAADRDRQATLDMIRGAS